ncbi:tyrosine-type recombinase/integrase [Parapusillimonas granuli]|uniref:Integrase arm-type DNA-binding domain-containing protein n=1 Tax=Parapusillimonas granuli TaxID=380911 RepID=A0A853G4H6_9BURK|nr:integrase arm-type DNA-binding domain-containing protein [Parapusillimonas granuli]MBB5215727.1 integrase [Parapusillimonas granuli]NYT51209.1 integrase arm-type DNA-binding domain-containing protein [Parapusillimonas granuli]NYT80240.1 integrase arm-type DNA-binding domain-containing protein [Alcaligenaceae bacterium]
MRLTVKAIELAQPAAKEYLLSDGNKLYLRVHPRGSKSWQFNYTNIEGKRVKLTLGTFPETSLASARVLAAEQREHLATGKDPRIQKQEEQQEAQRQALATFEQVAREWHAHAKKVHEWSEDYSQKILRQLELHAFPKLGRHPIGSLNRLDVLQCLEAISLAGTRETAIRLRESLQRVFARAVTLGLLEPGQNYMAKGVADFKLRSPIVKHYATILEPAKIGQLMRDIRGYTGHYIVCCALRIMPYVFQRPGQIRMMEWEQLDLDAGVWICPPRMMKMREAHKNSGQAASHVVPLPTQVIDILHQLHTVTGPVGPVFKSVSRRRGKNGYSRYISNNTMNSALRALGYDTQTDITGHGFRAMARTLIRERLGWDREMIEKHLAHVSDEELGEAYDRTRFIEQRHEMAQAWADYLDQLADRKIPVTDDSARSVTPNPFNSHISNQARILQ